MREGDSVKSVKRKTGHKESARERIQAQEECAEEKCKGENTKRLYEENDMSNRRMTWWKRLCWILSGHGSCVRSAKGRRSVWRTAKRAAEEARDGDFVEETHRKAEEAERQQG